MQSASQYRSGEELNKHLQTSRSVINFILLASFLLFPLSYIAYYLDISTTPSTNQLPSSNFIAIRRDESAYICIEETFNPQLSSIFVNHKHVLQTSHSKHVSWRKSHLPLFQPTSILTASIASMGASTPQKALCRRLSRPPWHRNLL
jgi:hypothetical protein